MKKMMKTMACMLLLSGALPAMGQEYRKTPTGIETTVGGNTEVCVDFYTPSTVRIVKYPTGKTPEKNSLSVTAAPVQVRLSSGSRDGKINVSSNRMKVELDVATGTVAFYDSRSACLMKESGAATFRSVDDAGTPTYCVRQAFTLDKDEAIYGLGNLENGRLSQRGVSRKLMPGNVEDGVPFFLSVKGYGVFWDNYAPTQFTDNERETFFESEVGDLVDYYFMYGGNADGVVAEMRGLTGEVPMFPLWSYGFWQSRERYKSQAELLGVVRKYRELGIPFDGIIQDWQYWGNNYLWNGMEFLNPDFPRPQEMIDEVHKRNAHIMISVWSSFGPQTKPYRELDEKGMLFDFTTWPQSGLGDWPPRMDYPSGVRVYDAYHPEARDIYWNHLRRLYDLKIDGWWMDSTEPDHLDFKPEDLDTKTYLGSFRKVRGAFPLMAVGGVYDHQRATSKDKRVFILTRSGFAGQQRYGCNVWTGDVSSTWQSLRNQPPALMNFSLTGNPHVNSDLGGFFAGAYNNARKEVSGANNPAFRELYVRWTQMGVFTPMMRSHGTDVPRELYLYGKAGEPIYDALVSAVRLRYTFLPYIYSTSWEVSHRQSTFMRALMMDFASDRRTWEIADEYMFGQSVLVAPVLKAQYTPEVAGQVSETDGWNREQNGKSGQIGGIDFTQPRSTEVYLPEGTAWYDFWTNTRHDGGQTLTRETAISTIPLYIKAGAILPLGPDVQYAMEKAWDNLEIRVYPGADGSFVLYEDEGDSYNYEHGVCTEIPFVWKDSARRLTIGVRQGAFEGMLKDRKFTVVLPDGSRKEVAYTGKKVSVRF